MPTKTKLTGKRLMDDYPEVREKYQEKLTAVQARLKKCKRGTMAQIARDLETSPSWLCQVISGNRISSATADGMVAWLDRHEAEYQIPPEKPGDQPQAGEKEGENG